MFDGLDLDHVDDGEATLRVRHGGAGTPRWAGATVWASGRRSVAEARHDFLAVIR